MISGTHLKRKLYQYFTQRVGLQKYRRGWLKGDCPSCGENKWGVNLSLMRTNCFRCKYNEKPIDAIMLLENLVTNNEVFKVLKAFEGIDFYEEAIELYQLKENVTLPEGYKNISRGDSILACSARNYLIKRGFNIKELAKAGWGYSNKDKYFGYIIMPFYRNGKLVYFNARRFLGDGPRFNNPLVEDFGLGKSMLMYNSDALLMYDRVFIVEGLMNARTIGDNAVSMGGKKVSNYQINLLIKSPVKKFIIGFDHDGYDDALELAIKLEPFKRVKVMPFKDARDINDLGRKRSLLITAKQRYLSYNQLILLKNG